MVHKLILDTNVILSALITKKTDVATVEVLNLLLKRKAVLLFCMDIIKEYVDILYEKKFGVDVHMLDDILLFLIKNGIEKTIKKSKTKLIDESDRKFYDLLDTDKEAYLITGNIKHYPKNKRIISPREFIDKVLPL